MVNEVPDILIRDAVDTDFPSIVDLNAAVDQYTSPMDLERLRQLDDWSDYHQVAQVGPDVAAFLLVMRENSAYPNDNHAWFSARYPKFLYVDRIVVSDRHAGKRIGSLLYEHLFHYARAHDVPLITCEYNLVPPNEPSRLFHQKFAFEQVGTQWRYEGSRQLSMQAAKTALNPENN